MPENPSCQRPSLKPVVVTLLALLLLGLAASGVVDEAGERYTESGFKRALVTFGIARGLNGAISVAQGTEVAFEPAGVGLTFTPGEILDPINDLVERFSWVMLVSATSLGVQRVLLHMTAWPGFTWLVGGVVLIGLVLLWHRHLAADGDRPRRWRRTWFHLAVALLVVRFAIPLISLANESLYRLFLEPQYAQSTAELEATTERIGRINRSTQEHLPREEAASNLLERARKAYDSVAESLNVDARVAELKAAAAAASEHTIQLIVVFVVQTILFPLVFIWLLFKLARRLGEALAGAARRVRE